MSVRIVQEDESAIINMNLKNCRGGKTVYVHMGHKGSGIQMRVHATVANWIPQMQWEALPEHRRDMVDLDEAGSSSWISGHISGLIPVLLPHFRIRWRIYICRVSQETLDAETEVKGLNPR